MKSNIRFVSYGTSFAATGGQPGEAVLGHNEVALDVGGICHQLTKDGPWVLDHHFVPEPYPSAAAAVLAHAPELAEYYSNQTTVVVTHVEPDFDALLSAWLFWRIVDGTLAPASEAGSWKTIDWLDGQVSNAPSDCCNAATLLAKYSACVDSARLSAIRCQRADALHSVFLAARHRRGFVDGMTWFFDAVWKAIIEEGRNPFLDPLFDRGGPLDLELRLLEVQNRAYEADIKRARKSIVTVPVASNFQSMFSQLQNMPLDALSSGNHELLSPDGHAVVDGAWIREPSCFLFKEWARLDMQNSVFGRGFDFLAVAYPGGRRAKNAADYFFSLDPERANGKHLYNVWLALQKRQAAAVQAGEIAIPADKTSVRRGFEARAAGHERSFFDPWWDGSNTSGTLVATPMAGAFGFPGTRFDLSDDPVANTARIELEFTDFGMAEIEDFPFLPARDDAAPVEPRRALVKIAPDQFPAAPEDSFRFVRVPLLARAVLPERSTITGRENQLAALAGSFLGSQSLPEFLVNDANGGSLIAWTRHGIVVFEPENDPRGGTSKALARAVQSMSDIMVQLQALSASLQRAAKDSKRIATAQPYRQRLLQAILALKLDAAKPEGEVIQRFLAATGFESVMHTLDTLNEDIDSIVRERDDRAQTKRDQTLQLILTVGTAIGLWISWNQMESLSIASFGEGGTGFWLRYVLGLLLAGIFAAVFWRVAYRSSD